MKVTAGVAAEDISSSKSIMGSEVKERGWRVGGLAAILGEGDNGG